MKRRAEQPELLLAPPSSSSAATASHCPVTASVEGAALLARSGRLLLRQVSGGGSRGGSGDFAAAAGAATDLSQQPQQQQPQQQQQQQQPFQQQQQQPATAHAHGGRHHHHASPPGSGRRASRLLLALALAARADYACPHSLIADDGAVRERLAACLATMARAEGSTASPFSPAARALLLYGIAATAPAERPLVAVQAAYTALCLLDDPAAAVAAARQLARLQAAHEPGHAAAQAAYALTLPQLQHACLWRVAESGGALLALHRSPGLLLHTGSARLPAEQLQEVQLAVSAAASILPRLEPANPKGLLAAGAAAAALHRPDKAARLRLRALRAAQQQHSAYWELRAAAAMFAGPVGVHLHPDAGDLHVASPTMQGAMLALAGAQPTLQLCEQALPAPWALRLGAEVATGRRRAAAAQAQLELVRQIAREGIGGRHFHMEVQAAASGGRPPHQQQQQAQQQQQQAQQQQQQQAQPGSAGAGGELHKAGRLGLLPLLKSARRASGLSRPGEQGSEGSCATGGLGQGALPASGTAQLSRFSE